MSNDDDFTDNLEALLIDGMNLSFMEFTDELEVYDFIEELKEFYMKDNRLSDMFFWSDDTVILHDEKGIKSNFGVLIDGQSIQFRTDGGPISDLKNAGRILMSTVTFIHTKLVEIGKVDPEGFIEPLKRSQIEVEEDTSKNNVNKNSFEDEDSESDSDFWL